MEISPTLSFFSYLGFQYYLKPFHAYEKGNLSWDAAWEVELAAKSFHANTFDPEVTLNATPAGLIVELNFYKGTGGLKMVFFLFFLGGRVWVGEIYGSQHVRLWRYRVYAADKCIGS